VDKYGLCFSYPDLKGDLLDLTNNEFVELWIKLTHLGCYMTGDLDLSGNVKYTYSEIHTEYELMGLKENQ